MTQQIGKVLQQSTPVLQQRDGIAHLKKEVTHLYREVTQQSAPVLKQDREIADLKREVINLYREVTHQSTPMPQLSPGDWNAGKGMAAPKNKALKRFNSYLEEVRGKLARHYRELQMKGERLTAAAVKDAYNGFIKAKKVEYSLLWVVSQHNTMMQQVLKKGSMKNYLTTERYLKAFLSKQLTGA